MTETIEFLEAMFVLLEEKEELTEDEEVLYEAIKESLKPPSWRELFYGKLPA